MSHRYRNENYQSESDDSDGKSSRYYTDDEFSDELSDTKKQSSSESSGDDRLNDAKVKEDFKSILTKGLAEIDLRPMGRKKDDESEKKSNKISQNEKSKKAVIKGKKIKDILRRDSGFSSITPLSPSSSSMTQYSMPNSCATTDFALYSPSTVASPCALTDSFQVTSPVSSFYNGSITNEDESIQSFCSNTSTDTTLKQYSSNALETNSDLLSFYPEINLDNLDDFKFSPDEFDKLDKEREENKKTCIYEICSLRAEDFFETINFKDEDGNLLLHHTAKLKTMKHMPSNLMNFIIHPKLLKDEEGLVEMDTIYFTEALISRASRSEKPSNIKNLINQSNKNNETPLMNAIQEDRLDILKLFYPYARLELRKEPYAHTCLHLACMNGSVECFQFLKQEYYSKRENLCFIDQCDSLGNTPLKLAIKFFSDIKPSNYYTIIQELIKMGRFNLNTQNNHGDRLVHLVCKNRVCPPSIKISILRSLKVTKYDLTFKQHLNSKCAVDLWTEIPINNEYNALQFINACVNS